MQAIDRVAWPSDAALTMPSRTLTRRLALVALPALPLLLSACASSSRGVPAARTTTATTTYTPPVRQPSRQALRDPKLQQIPGVQGVIGSTAANLTRQFGPPRLDVVEGDARKLQFAGTACVLDIFLYPTSQSPEPIATYVDARRASDGKDVDRAACVRALLGK